MYIVKENERTAWKRKIFLSSLETQPLTSERNCCLYFLCLEAEFNKRKVSIYFKVSRAQSKETLGTLPRDLTEMPASFHLLSWRPPWPRTFSALLASLSVISAITSLSPVLFTALSSFLIPSSVARNCWQWNCGMPRSAPGIISAKSEDQQEWKWDLECRPPASTPGRDSPVWLSASVSNALARLKGLTSCPALLQAWSPCGLSGQ